MFERARSFFENDGAVVGSVVDTPVTCPGGAVSGRVRVQGGKGDIFLREVVVGLVAHAQIEVEDHEKHTWEPCLRLFAVDLHRAVLGRDMWVAGGEELTFPFTVPVPWEVPITAVGPAILPVTVGVRTELVALDARDASELNPAVQVQPLPSQRRVLDALGAVGAEFLDVGRPVESPPTGSSPLVLRFVPPWWFATAVEEVGLTFVTTECRLGVYLVATRRRKLFTAGRRVPAYHVMTHEQAAVTDWTSLIGGWLAAAAGTRTR